MDLRILIVLQFEKMKLKIKPIVWEIIFFCFFVAWAATLIFFVYKDQQKTVEFKAAELTAPRHSTAEYPFYAQFFISQTVNFNRPRILDSIEVPVLNRGNGPVQVTALVDFGEGILEENKFDLPVNVNYLRIPVLNKKEVSSLKIVFSSPDISALDRESAPVVFYEPSETGYKEGLFSVADIPKKGNIALTVVARQTKWEQLKEGIEKRPLRLGYLARDLSFLLLLVFAPLFIYFPVVGNRKKNHK